MKPQKTNTVYYCPLCRTMYKETGEKILLKDLSELIFLSAYKNIDLLIKKFFCPICKNQEVVMRYKKKLTRHHICPRSRGGSNSSYNIAKVPEREHDLYHRLFENKTPDEIMEYLNKTFWNGNYFIRMI